MTEIHAKPIVKDKFWVIEQDGIKVGTLQKENDKFMLSSPIGIKWYDAESEIISQFGSKFFLLESGFTIPPEEINECHGFPTKTKPYNAMYDVRKRLPLFTKQPQSKCFHCAGWYAIKFKTWIVVLCPKLITVERYDTIGPFKTRDEAMREKCIK